MQERLFAGKAGMRASFGGHVLGNWLPEIQKINPDATATYISGIKNDKGVVRGPGWGTGIFRINVVLVEGKQEATVKYFDFLLSDEGYDMLKFGLEGIHFNMAAGKREFTEEYNMYNISCRTYLALVRRYNDPSFFVNQKLPEEERALMGSWIDLCVKNVSMSEDFGFRPPSATEQSFIDYKTVIKQAISKIVLGQMEIDEWDSVLDGWYKAGGDDYLREVNEYIAKNQ
jgi:putative aldouronate transport system substrate-binding protein